MALNLAAPHTWPACLIPLLVTVILAAYQNTLSISLTITMMLIVILMQSSVNTFNDYFDYVKGTDTSDAQVDETDAVLVYNNINPRSALLLAIGYLGVAFLLGIYPIIAAGWIPLVIACIGALFVVLYSAGKTPLSYLPLGEIVSGLVMGGLIPLAAYYVLTGRLNFWVLLCSIPMIIGIGLIMMTNNVSDIERDESAGRKTLPALLGHTRTVTLYHTLVVVWIGAICVLTALFCRPGCLILPFMLIVSYPLLKALFSNPLLPNTRLQSMSQILNLNIVLGLSYALALSVGTPLLLIF